MMAAATRLGKRQDEIETRLQCIGIEPTRRWQDLQLESDRESRVRQFCELLPELGPLFARFGRYLSSRLDRLPAEDCHTLSGIDDRRAELSIEQIHSTLHLTLGASCPSMPSLEPEPIASRLLYQMHHGRLPNGRRVRVKVLRDREDPAILDCLPDPLSGLGWSPDYLKSMILDFRSSCELDVNLAWEEAALRSLGRVSTASERFTVARVVAGASAGRVLTIEAPEPHETVVSRWPNRGLADLWLHLLFEGHLAAEQLTRDDLELVTPGDLKLLGGLFRAIDHPTSESLANYLSAATADDPEAIFDALSELTDANEENRSQELRHRLRHVVPRRDGRFGPEPPGLPELLLAHWSEAIHHGLEPRPPLLAFYRGLIHLRELVGPSLSQGILREAIRVRQILRGAERARDLLPPPWLPGGAEAIVERWIRLPRDSNRPAYEHVQSKTSRSASDGPWIHLAVYLLLSATVVLWGYRLPEGAGQAGSWIVAVALLLLSLGAIRRL
jgi:hypothetical protein